MLKFKKIKFLILFLLLFLFLIGATFIFAQKPLEINYPGISGVTTPTTTKTALPDYIKYIFQFSLFLGALIAFGSFIYGGVRYLSSSGSPSVQKDGQSQITAGIFGLIILVSAYLLLNTINPQLVSLDVSLFEKAPRVLTRGVMPTLDPATLVEIPLGGVIENLWGTKDEPKKADCYNFDLEGINPSGDATVFLTDHNRLDCIEKLSKAVEIKAENLKKPIEELQKLYDCQNCCRDCCKNVCDWVNCGDVCDYYWDDEEEDWQWENCEEKYSFCEETKNEDYFWAHCGEYQCCEGEGMVRQYLYQKCPYNCCEFFQRCQCKNCEGCICIKEDENGEPVCCNFENDPDKPYEDLLVRSLIDKNLLSDEEKENDPYEDLIDIKTALKELRIKIGLFPLTEEVRKPENLDILLADEDTKDLIKEILIGNPPEEEKLKEFLKNKWVMKYLVENDWLSVNRNLAKIMLQNLDLLKNEIAINEIAWMGTETNSTDEWIELYNNTRGTIDLNGWKLTVNGNFETELSGTISSQGFYLLENLDGNLSDNGETLELYDEFGNLEEVVDCSFDWFAGDNENKVPMERIDPKYENGSIEDNWTTSLFSEGTPNAPNTLGVVIDSYSSFNSLVSEMRNKLRQEENLREKLILVLRQDENLEKMLKTKNALSNILMGDEQHLKALLMQKEILGLLLENKENLNSLLEDNNAEDLIQDILVKTGDWKKDEEWEQEWQDLMDNLNEVQTNLKLIKDFQRDLEWVLSTQNLMRGCEEDPISVDQLRVPEELISNKIEKIPEWEGIEAEVPWIEGIDPATFYCHKLLW